MAAPVTTESVWRALSKNTFAVLSWVTPKSASRSAGIIYLARDRKLMIGAESHSWKVRHIRENPNVSITATLKKRIPFMPWLPLPDATISFHGKARVVEPPDVDPALMRDLTRGMVDDPELRANSCVIEVIPEGEFVTYGIDVSTLAMRDPNAAQGRAPVS